MQFAHTLFGEKFSTAYIPLDASPSFSLSISEFALRPFSKHSVPTHALMLYCKSRRFNNSNSQNTLFARLLVFILNENMPKGQPTLGNQTMRKLAPNAAGGRESWPRQMEHDFNDIEDGRPLFAFAPAFSCEIEDRCESQKCQNVV
jgi:hypothetical protein